VITIGFHWRLTLTNQYTWLEQPDVVARVLPEYQYQAGEWHAGRAPLWDPYEDGGQSTIVEPEAAAASPFNLILFSLPLRNGWMRERFLNWQFVLLHYLGVLFCYLLCCELGLGMGASMAGGVAFGLSGILGSSWRPAILHSGIWIPLVFLFLVRAIQGKQARASAVLAGAMLGLSILGGDPQIPLVAGLAGAGLLAEKRRFSALGVFLLAAAGAGALQWIPQWVYWKPVDYNAEVFTALPSTWLLNLWIPGPFFEGVIYIGISVLLFAVVGLAAGRDKPYVRWFAAIGLGSALYALGGRTAFHGVIYSLFPPARALYPSSAILLFHLSCAVLAALGIEEIRSNAAKWITPVAGGLAALLFGIVMIFAAIESPRLAETEWLGVPAVAAALAAVLVYAARKGNLGPRVVSASAIFLIAFEAGNGAPVTYRNRDLGWAMQGNLTLNSDIAEYLKSRGGPARASLDSKAIPYRFGDWYGVETYSGTHPALFSVNYYVAQTAPKPGLEDVYTGASGLKVFHDPSAPARVRVIRSTPCAEADALQLVSWAPNRVTAQGKVGCAGTVLVADSYAPGWTAKVDGARATILPVDDLVRGVVVGAGQHRIEMRYRPRFLVWGAVLSALSLLGAALVAVGLLRRKTARQE
jgi:Bacterial membrane protein YfhO